MYLYIVIAAAAAHAYVEIHVVTVVSVYGVIAVDVFYPIGDGAIQSVGQIFAYGVEVKCIQIRQQFLRYKREFLRAITGFYSMQKAVVGGEEHQVIWRGAGAAIGDHHRL